MVSVINRQQTKAKRARQKVKMLKFRVDALEELALILDSTVDSRSIARCVYNEALHLLDTMQQLDPTASFLEAVIASAQKLASDLADNDGHREISRVKPSDAQIARTQQALSEGARILRQQCNRGEISVTELEAYTQELNWLKLHVEIVSLVAQGMWAMNKNDVIGAFTFYRRAQNCLIQSDQHDPRRQQMIRELNEMLGKRRFHLSFDLMPEAKAILEMGKVSQIQTPDIDLLSTDNPGDLSQIGSIDPIDLNS